MNERGLPVVLSSPSGCGKSTVIQHILKLRPDIVFSVSSTTRPPRHYEEDGIHYRFISEDEFRAGIKAGRFLEWEQVHGNLYGTDRLVIEENLSVGKHVILDLDVNGRERIQNTYPEAIIIFLYPPSKKELRKRLTLRGTDSSEDISQRISRYPMEMDKGKEYTFQILNDNLDHTIDEVIRIIDNKGQLQEVIK